MDEYRSDVSRTVETGLLGLPHPLIAHSLPLIHRFFLLFTCSNSFLSTILSHFNSLSVAFFRVCQLWRQPSTIVSIPRTRKSVNYFCSLPYRTYLGVTPPISTAPPTKRDEVVTETMMAELRRQGVFESEEESRTRYESTRISVS